MARTVGKLTALRVARDLAPGMYADGAGLYLQVTGAGAKSWIYRFSLNGSAREMGLGTLSVVSLSEGRIKAGECRRLRQEGVDPIEGRKARRHQVEVAAAKRITFKESAANYIASHSAGWRNAKHAAQWKATLETYAEPILGALSIQAIDTALVVKVLEPIWQAKPETANRLRGRIEAILDWAKVRGLREGENPARWRGHLQYQLPSKSKLRRGNHPPPRFPSELAPRLSQLHLQGGGAPRAPVLAVLLSAARPAC